MFRFILKHKCRASKLSFGALFFCLLQFLVNRARTPTQINN
jgi:hypothetical protein